MKAKLGRPKIVGSARRIAVRIRLPEYKVKKIKHIVALGGRKNITQLIEESLDTYLGYK